MDLDMLMTEADPARRVPLDGPDSAAAVRLYREITEGAPAPSRARRLRRRVTVPAVAGAGAAGLATAVVMALLPGSPAAPLAAAAAVLDQAAATAAHQSAGPALGPGQYFYLKTIETAEVYGGSGANGHGGAEMSASLLGGPVYLSDGGRECTFVRQLWLARDGSSRLVYTPEAGQATSPAQGCHPFVQTESGNSGGSNPYFGPLDGSSLPTDPAALEQAIAYRYGVAPDITMFALVSMFLESSPSPALRAGLYGVLERLPGIENLGPVTDRLGRHGISVGFPDGKALYKIIFDPATSAVLETAGTEKGAQPGYTVYVTSAVVDSDTAVPPAASGSPSPATHSSRSPGN